jgi:hypothetical protein
MKRRDFITLLAAAAAWPLAAGAQERMRRIGVLLPAAENDPVFQSRLTACRLRLVRLLAQLRKPP